MKTGGWPHFVFVRAVLRESERIFNGGSCRWSGRALPVRADGTAGVGADFQRRFVPLVRPGASYSCGRTGADAISRLPAAAGFDSCGCGDGADKSLRRAVSSTVSASYAQEFEKRRKKRVFSLIPAGKALILLYILKTLLLNPNLHEKNFRFSGGGYSRVLCARS